MRRDRILTDAELRRMPAGERLPRLRALAVFYDERLAAAESRAPYSRQQTNITSHRRSLAKIEHVVRAIG